MSLLFVFLGGGAGSVVRFLLGKTAVEYGQLALWGTLVANALASLFLGYLLFSASRQADPQTSKLLLATGFCGGFSTFSTFGAEAYALMQQGRAGAALGYLTASVLIGMLAIAVGSKL